MRVSSAILVGITSALAFTSTLHAQSTFLDSDAAFGTPQGRIFWSALGTSGSPVSSPATVAVTGLPGLYATVITSFAGHRVDEGDGWIGSFARGDALLAIGGPLGPIRLSFSRPIAAFGTQLNSWWGVDGVFEAHIEAFDVTDDALLTFDDMAAHRLGEYTIHAPITTFEDNSAPFLGIASERGIRSVWVRGGPGPYDELINDVRVTETTTTPEPTGMLLLGSGLVGVLGLFRRTVLAKASRS